MCIHFGNSVGGFSATLILCLINPGTPQALGHFIKGKCDNVVITWGFYFHCLKELCHVYWDNSLKTTYCCCTYIKKPNKISMFSYLEPGPPESACPNGVWTWVVLPGWLLPRKAGIRWLRGHKATWLLPSHWLHPTHTTHTTHSHTYHTHTTHTLALGLGWCLSNDHASKRTKVQTPAPTEALMDMMAFL